MERKVTKTEESENVSVKIDMSLSKEEFSQLLRSLKEEAAKLEEAKANLEAQLVSTPKVAFTEELQLLRLQLQKLEAFRRRSSLESNLQQVKSQLQAKQAELEAFNDTGVVEADTDIEYPKIRDGE